MKIFKTKQTQEIDRLTIEREPISSYRLMTRASLLLTQAMLPYLEEVRIIHVLAGNGNNGGDAYIVANELSKKGKIVLVYQKEGKKTEDCQRAFEAFSQEHSDRIYDISRFSPSKGVIIDGLFGSGLNRPLEGVYAEVVGKANLSGLPIFAIDVPSGLFGEDNKSNNHEAIIRATRTFTIGAPKLSFFLAENDAFVGDWEVIDIHHDEKTIEETETSFFYTSQKEVDNWIQKRKRFSHKGTFGHALLIAGSYGMMGAAQLAAKSALRTGCGLLTAHIPQKGYEIMQIAVPEAIVSLDNHAEHFSQAPLNLDRYNAVGIGPGLSKHNDCLKGFKELLRSVRQPMVIDADALNLLAEEKDLLNHLPENSILTPHPKEFERIAGKHTDSLERIEAQRALSMQHRIIIVLKGAYTSVSLPDGTIHFNTSGNPCLATAGSGDVLTGVILSLLSQGYTPEVAARLGVYLHGRAADVYARETDKPCMIASDIIEYLWKK